MLIASSSRTSEASVGTYGPLSVADPGAVTVDPDTRSLRSLPRDDRLRLSKPPLQPNPAQHIVSPLPLKERKVPNTLVPNLREHPGPRRREFAGPSDRNTCARLFRPRLDQLEPPAVVLRVVDPHAIAVTAPPLIGAVEG